MASRLGRGLEALFQENDIKNVEEIHHIQEGEVVSELMMTQLRPNPYQPRKHFDAGKLEELAISIKEHGVLQPIIVKKDIKGYIIVAGERRFKASQLAKLTTIPAIVREYSDDLMMQHALIENLQREDLNPIEEAKSYRLIMQKMNLTQEKFSEKIGKSRTYITNMMRLLNLPEFVTDRIETSEISVGHAKILAGIKDEEMILKFAMMIKEEQLSVRELEEMVRDVQVSPKQTKHQEKLPEDTYIKSLESHLKSHFGTKVAIKDKKGKGQIVINYLSNDDLNRVLEVLGIELT
ncbi:MAG: ParB/RepB/Spo0J family partition protein [Defluviitaleaceae bacterium]|nr:ParB/RepB/Spo0J family partition protein [Defluviitaleaceae bacterium]